MLQMQADTEQSAVRRIALLSRISELLRLIAAALPPADNRAKCAPAAGLELLETDGEKVPVR